MIEARSPAPFDRDSSNNLGRACLRKQAKARPYRFRGQTAAVFAILIGIATVPVMIQPAGAQQLSEQAKKIGHKFMCMCSCNQVLTECNHVGCSTSAAMLKELNQSLANGGTEESITQAFLQEFGTKVYAEPPKSGFSLVAWAMPTVYLVIGAVLVIFVISRWRKRPASESGSAGSAGPEISPELLERAKAQAARETED